MKESVVQETKKAIAEVTVAKGRLQSTYINPDMSCL